MKSLSAEYRNTRYRMLTICDVLESNICKDEKKREEYADMLESAMNDFEEVKKKIKKAMEGSNQEWVKRIKALIADARLDLTITEELRERIVWELKELAERIGTHEDEG